MPTRTIFFHISGLSQTIFYVLAYLALAVCFWGFYRRFRLWRKGKPAPKVRDWPGRLRSLFDQAVLHRLGFPQTGTLLPLSHSRFAVSYVFSSNSFQNERADRPGARAAISRSS